MIRFRAAILMGGLWIVMVSGPHASAEEPTALHPRLVAYIEARVAEFDSIPSKRTAALKKLSRYVDVQAMNDRESAITFICTHNSRRSQMSQLWAAAAAAYYGVSKVQTFSGGAESTAFNRRAVAAMRHAGFVVANTTGGENLRYEFTIGEGLPLCTCFSKVYDRPPNPDRDFCAVMTCSEADRNCPTVEGAVVRIVLPYDDPKAADNTPAERRVYGERCEQIAREMLYAFSVAAANESNEAAN